MESKPLLLPDDEIWRYMPLSGFLDLLQRTALFFSSLHALMRQDPWEGCIPLDVLTRIVDFVRSDYPNENRESLIDTMRKETCVCCWHRNCGGESGSAAMWKEYGKDGISIVSDVGSLRRS